MSKVSSKDFVIPKAQAIPYGGGEEGLNTWLSTSAKNHKANSKCIYGLKRLRNYICCVLAYIAPSNSLRVKLNRWKGVHIADGAYIGMFCFLDNAYPEWIFIEEKVSINAGCYVIAHFNPMAHFRRTVLAKVDPIVIKEGVMVGVRSIISPGVTIGEYSIVSENSSVVRSVPPMSIVRGNPAEVVGKVRLEKLLQAEMEARILERTKEIEK